MHCAQPATWKSLKFQLASVPFTILQSLPSVFGSVQAQTDLCCRRKQAWPADQQRWSRYDWEQDPNGGWLWIHICNESSRLYNILFFFAFISHHKCPSRLNFDTMLESSGNFLFCTGQEKAAFCLSVGDSTPLNKKFVAFRAFSVDEHAWHVEGFCAQQSRDSLRINQYLRYQLDLDDLMLEKDYKPSSLLSEQSC